jgi:VIT1/CCC1 family predicted Fe2+/Mn2+ transporter
MGKRRAAATARELQRSAPSAPAGTVPEARRVLRRSPVLNQTDQRQHHEQVDPHVRARWLSDVILGAQDGVVNTLGVVLGVLGASGSSHVTFAAGLAAGAAEALSMAAVAYTSSAARGDLFRAERARELRHVVTTPAIERDEIRCIYAKKGFRGELLDRVVDTICSNTDVWIAVMMSEEHGLERVDEAASRRSALVVGGASLVGAAVPVLPFAFAPRALGSIAAIVLGGLSLFALGFLKARLTAGSRSRSGAVLAGIGLASAAAGYLIGVLLGGS